MDGRAETGPRLVGRPELLPRIPGPPVLRVADPGAARRTSGVCIERNLGPGDLPGPAWRCDAGGGEGRRRIFHDAQFPRVRHGRALLDRVRRGRVPALPLSAGVPLLHGADPVHPLRRHRLSVEDDRFLVRRAFAELGRRPRLPGREHHRFTQSSTGSGRRLFRDSIPHVLDGVGNGGGVFHVLGCSEGRRSLPVRHPHFHRNKLPPNLRDRRPFLQIRTEGGGRIFPRVLGVGRLLKRCDTGGRNRSDASWYRIETR